MTDTDRLREAADHIDIEWDSMESYAARWAVEHDKVGRSTAALLRAASSHHDNGRCLCGDGPPDELCAAALALADTILGTQP